MPRSERRPWSPFYWADWLADPDVRAMTRDERGAYLDILAYSAQTDTPGVMTEERVRFWSGYTADEWPEHRSRISQCFSVSDEIWTQERQRSESLKAARATARATAERRKGAYITNEKRWGYVAPATLKSRFARAQSESQSETESQSEAALLPFESDSQKEKHTCRWSDMFAEFWKSYPHVPGRSHRKPALQLWERIQPHSSAMFQVIMAGLESCKSSPDWTKESGAFIGSAEKWLRHYGWDTHNGNGVPKHKSPFDMSLEELREATGRNDL